jgi:CRP-like cAMP-binding protein
VPDHSDFRARQYLPSLLALVLQAFRRSYERIQNLELKTAQERIAYRLLFLGKYYGRTVGNTIVIDVPATYQDLSECLSLTRETVNRVMRKFITNKLVSRDKQKLTISDANKLKEMLGDQGLNF